MGTSYRYYKEDIKEYLENRWGKGASILDVGAGNGTYYDLLGDYFRNIDAVEVYAPNIVENCLRGKYRNVFNEDIREFNYTWYDIVIFGDIIEHLEVEEAQKVLEYARKHSREIVVAVPYEYKQGICYGNVYEIHKQDDLTEELMQERYPYLRKILGNEEYGYYVLGELTERE